MHTLCQRIDHTLEVFRLAGRRDIVIGLTAADWDELCAELIAANETDHTDPGLTKARYDGVPIEALPDNGRSFVSHDFGGLHERRFPLEALEPLDLTPA